MPYGEDLAAVLLGAGLALTVAAERRFRRAGTPVRHSEAPTVLVTEGCFAWSRNPMYLGMAIALAGLALMAATRGGVIGGARDAGCEPSGDHRRERTRACARVALRLPGG
jgi:hypothetical protein